MMLALTVTGWGIAMTAALSATAMFWIIAFSPDQSEGDRAELFLSGLFPLLFIFAAYGIYCWFGGTP
jgi:hypothetical protein